MQEMEEEYSRDEQANNTVMSRGVFVTIGTAMDEDQPGKLHLRCWIRGRGHLLLLTMTTQESCLLRLLQCSSRRNSAPVRATTTLQTCRLQHLRRRQPMLLQLIE